MRKNRILALALASCTLLFSVPLLRADNIPSLWYEYQIQTASWGPNNLSPNDSGTGGGYLYQTAPYSFSESDSGYYPPGSLNCQYNANGCVISDYGSATASLSGTADYGHLHGYSSSTVNWAGNCYSAVANSCQGYASATVLVQFNDWITFSSSTLPQGTPVSYVVTGTLDDSISYTPTDPTVNTPPYYCSGAEEQTVSVISSAGSILDSACQPAASKTVSTTYTSTVGGTDELEASLFVNGRADEAQGLGYDQVIIDASDTANFTVQVLTPGVTFTSASGATYQSMAEVPEPGSFLLCSIVLFAALVAWRRKRGANMHLA